MYLYTSGHMVHVESGAPDPVAKFIVSVKVWGTKLLNTEKSGDNIGTVN